MLTTMTTHAHVVLTILVVTSVVIVNWLIVYRR